MGYYIIKQLYIKKLYNNLLYIIYHYIVDINCFYYLRLIGNVYKGVETLEESV